MSSKNVITGTAAGTIAAGDDTRFSQITSNSASITRLTLTPTATKTTAYTAAAQDFVIADASGAAFSVTLPVAPADGTLIAVKKIDASVNIVTVLPGSGATFVTGGASIALAVTGQSVTWRYQSSGTKWTSVQNDLPLAAVDTRYMLQSATVAPVYVYNTYAAAPALPANSVVISITGA